MLFRSRITAPPDPTGSTEGATAIGKQVSSTPPGPPEQTLILSPLPLAVPVSAWRRDQDGVIWRSELLAQTPLPWWQRFPIDFATDVLPVAYRSEAAVTVSEAPLTAYTRADLDREAAAAGYAPAPIPDVAPAPKQSP